MNIKRKRIVYPAVLALSILVVGILSGSTASAHRNGGYTAIVQKLAERFSVDEAQVQEVFDEFKDEKRADSYAHFAENLNDLVIEGSLTEDQKEALLDKHEQMRDKLEELQGLAGDEKYEQMKVIKEEFMAFIESEGIDMSVIGSVGFGMKKGFDAKKGFHRGHFWKK